MKREPAYIAVYRKLKSDIREDEYHIGELLPTEPELEKRFNVSRTTIRKAIEMLANDGYLSVKQGRGTQVLDFSTSQDLNVVTSISETLRRRGFEVRSKRIFVDQTDASLSLANELKISIGEPVVRIQRLQLADEIPVAIMKNYIPGSKVPGLKERAANLDELSLYLFLEKEYNLQIDSAEDTIFSKPSDFTDAEMLQIPIGTPLLCLNRVSFVKNIPITVDRISIRYDKYEFHVTMTGRKR